MTRYCVFLVTLYLFFYQFLELLPFSKAQFSPSHVCEKTHCLTCIGHYCAITCKGEECQSCPLGDCCTTPTSKCHMCRGETCCNDLKCNLCVESCLKRCYGLARCHNNCFERCIPDDKLTAEDKKEETKQSLIKGPTCCEVIHPKICEKTWCFIGKHKECSSICISHHVHFVQNESVKEQCILLGVQPYFYCGQYAIKDCDICYNCKSGNCARKCPFKCLMSLLPEAFYNTPFRQIPRRHEPEKEKYQSKS